MSHGITALILFLLLEKLPYGVAHDIRKYSYFSAFPTAAKA